MKTSIAWIQFRLGLTRLRVDLCWWIAPEYCARTFKRRFDELPESARRVLLERHGLKTL